MKKALILPVFLMSSHMSAYAGETVLDCTGSSDQGTVQLQIAKSPADPLPDAMPSSMQGYFEADVSVNGVSVYSTDYLVYNPADSEYFTSGNSDLVLEGPPDFDEPQLYLHVWNADGTITTPSFDTIPLNCQ